MTQPATELGEVTPRTMARATGALFLATVVCGIIAEAFISQRLIDAGNAATTASNILTNESLYRLGFSVYLLEMTAQVAMTVLFYYLLKPVSRTMSLLAAAFSLTGCVIKAFSRVFYFAPLLLLGADWASGYTLEQQQSLASMFLRLNEHGAAMALIFFGFSTVVRGWLVLKSTFLPQWLGILSLVGGIGWLTFLSPSLGMRLFPLVAGIGILGSIATILWLLIVGVNDERWRQRAAASATSIWR